MIEDIGYPINSAHEIVKLLYSDKSEEKIGKIDKTFKGCEITGFDMRELYIYQLFEVNENQIYFNGSLLTLDNALINYYNSGDGVYLTEAFSINSVTLEENNLITSVSYNGYSQSVTTLYELYTTLYSLDEGTTFTLTSIDLSTDTVIRTEFVI